MAQMFISPIVVRAFRDDSLESFDCHEHVTWYVIHEETGERLSDGYRTYEEAATWRKEKESHA